MNPAGIHSSAHILTRSAGHSNMVGKAAESPLDSAPLLPSLRKDTRQMAEYVLEKKKWGPLAQVAWLVQCRADMMGSDGRPDMVTLGQATDVGYLSLFAYTVRSRKERTRGEQQVSA